MKQTYRITAIIKLKNMLELTCTQSGQVIYWQMPNDEDISGYTINEEVCIDVAA